jgi:hypothetical protein
MHWLAAAGFLLVAFAAAAHHSPAAFDQAVVLDIEGTVTEFRWGNPHVYLSVETAAAGGERVIQEIEAGPAAQLSPRGLTRDRLRVGDRVTVRANPNRRGAGRIVLGTELTTSDGSRFPLHSRALQSLDAGGAVATTIAGTWVPRPEGFLGLGGAIRSSWPLTESGRAVLAGDFSAASAAQAECTPPGPPTLMANSVPIVVAVDDESVVLDIDWAQARRVVHIGKEHPEDAEPALLGHSVGHWERNVLVIDTVGFTAHAEGMGFQFPSSEAKHTVERLSLGEGGQHLDYEIVIEDPRYLVSSATYRTRWDYQPGQTLSNAPCDPVSARRFLDD